MYLAELAVTCIDSHCYAHVICRGKGEPPAMVLLEVVLVSKCSAGGCRSLFHVVKCGLPIKRLLIGHFVTSSP
jgi:hypothetical protein